MRALLRSTMVCVLCCLPLAACNTAQGDETTSATSSVQEASPAVLAGIWEWLADFKSGPAPLPPQNRELSVFHADGTGVSIFATHNPHAMPVMATNAVAGAFTWKLAGSKGVEVKFTRNILGPDPYTPGAQRYLGYLRGIGNLTLIDRDHLSGEATAEVVGMLDDVCGMMGKTPPCQMRVYGLAVEASRLDPFPGLLTTP